MTNTTTDTSKSLTFDLDSYQELYGKYRALQKEDSTDLSEACAVISTTIAVAILTLTMALSYHASYHAGTWTPSETLRAIAPVIIPLIVLAIISYGISRIRQHGLKKRRPERIAQQLNAMVKEYLVDRYGIQNIQLLEVGASIRWHELLLETLQLSMRPAKVQVLDADQRTKVFPVRLIDGKPTFIAYESI